MPTRGRKEWAKRALERFGMQDYPNTQLIILDDTEDPSFDDVPDVIGRGHWSTVNYVRAGGRLNIPMKRNRLCEMADGEIIVHWDDDDFSAADRISDQVKTLEDSGKAVTGYNSILFHEAHTQRWGCWRLYAYHAFGTSLCYLKSWWTDHRFNEGVSVGEDNEFVHVANQAGEIITVPGDKMIVARAHPGNTSPKDMDNCKPIEPSLIPQGFCA